VVHDTACVHPRALIGENVKIWNWVQIREDARIGDNSIISKGVYVDFGVRIGCNVKIQNNVSVYHGVTIEDGVFIGPHVCFTNDKSPRAINPDGSLKAGSDWTVSPIVIRFGSSIGANATVIPGITVGKFAMIGAGAVVTKDVPDFGLAVGCPARLVGYVCPCGERLKEKTGKDAGILHCERCQRDIEVTATSGGRP
jgi:UDP-2-acetamido-3-amino-2,3-dideoxy-glucuronate N-acetyltransferase